MGVNNVNSMNQIAPKPDLTLDVRRAKADVDRFNSIFNEVNSSYLSSKESYEVENFQKSIKQNAFESVEKNLSYLRSKQSNLEIKSEITDSKYQAHEAKVENTDQFKSLKGDMTANQALINAKRSILSQRAKGLAKQAENPYAKIQTEVNVLKLAESVLLGEIKTIKSQIKDLKSGKAVVADIQKMLTGSTTSTGVDVSKLVATDSSTAAVLGGNQASETIEKEVKAETEKMAEDAKAEQEDAIELSKDQMIAQLESLLAQKETELTKTQSDIKTKEATIKDAPKEVDDKYKDDAELKTEIDNLLAANAKIETELEALNPEKKKFANFETFMSNVVFGKGETGNGINPDMERTREEYDTAKDAYNDQTDDTDQLEELFGFNSLLKTETKSDLSNYESVYQTVKAKMDINKAADNIFAA